MTPAPAPPPDSRPGSASAWLPPPCACASAASAPLTARVAQGTLTLTPAAPTASRSTSSRPNTVRVHCAAARQGQPAVGGDRPQAHMHGRAGRREERAPQGRRHHAVHRRGHAALGSPQRQPAAGRRRRPRAAHPDRPGRTGRRARWCWITTRRDPLYGIGGYNATEDASAGLLRSGKQKITAGEQGHAGAPLVWSTAGYGVLVDTHRRPRST